LLARLFTKPSNLLVLDEPTNDLDVETLELLEEMLLDYSGTLLLVSHDRAFLNHAVTSTLAFEGDGSVSEYVGGYDDWLRQRRPRNEPDKAEKASVRAEKPERQRNRSLKKSYKEQRELEALPQRIESLEAEQEELYQTMADPAFYRQESAEIAKAQERLKRLEHELEASYQRWEALEEI